MFDSIRAHRRWLMVFLLLLVFPSFVFFGIQGYERFLGGEGGVAQVAGQPITQQELDTAQREQLERIRQALGQNFDQQLFDTPQARAATLDSLIGDRVVTAEATKEHLLVSEARLRETIASVPVFQQDGQFNYDRYREVLRNEGLSEQGFEQRVRTDLMRQTLRQAVAQSAFAPAPVLERIQRIVEEQREVRELRFRPEDFAAKVKVGEEALRAYFDNNRREFETPESVRVEYVVLTLSDVAAQISVPDTEIKTYYENNQARFGDAEQRRASHILITAGEGGSAKDKDAARKQAQELLPRAKAGAAEFAKLAREFSKDPGSAAKGGDLGFFSRNMMVKPFEDAAFALKAGEVSDVIESDFGFHIIRLAEIKPAQIKPLDQARAEIEAELRRQQAQKAFAEKEELFKNTTYEQSDSLKPAADKLKLQVQTLDRLTREGVPARPGTPQIFSARVVQALFSDDAIKAKRNIEAVEIGPSAWMSARVAEHRPAALRPFEEVQKDIRARLEREEAIKLARAAGEEKLSGLQKASSDAGFGAARTISRGRTEGLPPAAVTAIMRASADKLPAYVGVEVDGGAFAVVKVMSAQVPDKALAERKQATQRALEQQSGNSDEQTYVQALRTKHKVRILNNELKLAQSKSDNSKGDSSTAKK